MMSVIQNDIPLFDYLKQYIGETAYSTTTDHSVTPKVVMDFIKQSDHTSGDYQIIGSHNMFSLRHDNYELAVGCIKFDYKDAEMFYVGVPQSFNQTIGYPLYLFACSDNAMLEEFSRTINKFALFKNGDIKIYDCGWRDLEGDGEELSSYTWDSLIINPEIKASIQKETEAFLTGTQKEIYDKLNLPYKRGFIFMGPPGCGKTLTAKIIANTYKIPLIYVIDVNYENEFNRIYDVAAQCAPCIVLVEDIDSVITGSRRSRFLNILDGLVTYQGILTIATTNHPEELDSALLNRPSRFDQKWLFGFPDETLKKQFVRKRIAKFYDDHTADSCEDAIDEITGKTQGFTFTILQELIILAIYDREQSGKELSTCLLAAHERMAEQVCYADYSKIMKNFAVTADSCNSIGFRQWSGD